MIHCDALAPHRPAPKASRLPGAWSDRAHLSDPFWVPALARCCPTLFADDAPKAGHPHVAPDRRSTGRGVERAVL